MIVVFECRETIIQRTLSMHEKTLSKEMNGNELDAIMAVCVCVCVHYLKMVLYNDRLLMRQIANSILILYEFIFVAFEKSSNVQLHIKIL